MQRIVYKLARLILYGVTLLGAALLPLVWHFEGAPSFKLSQKPTAPAAGVQYAFADAPSVGGGEGSIGTGEGGQGEGEGDGGGGGGDAGGDSCSGGE